MTRIAQPIRDNAIVNEDGKMLPRFYAWAQQVTNLQLLTGTGSPEGVVVATVGTLYMDESGTAGSIMYIKRDADVSGDRSQGWIAI